MKKAASTILIVIIGVMVSSCGRLVGEDPPLNGYWKGYYIYKEAIRGGKQSPNEFAKEAMPIYCKIEQTGNVVVGRYTSKFDGDRFKKEIPEGSQMTEGFISGENVVLRFHDISHAMTIPVREAQMKLKSGVLSGVWKEEWASQVTYSGVMELRKY